MTQEEDENGALVTEPSKASSWGRQSWDSWPD